MGLLFADAPVPGPITGRGSAYDVRPVEGFGGALFGVLFAPLNFIRKIGQGACAGLLTLLGAMHLAKDASLSDPSVASLAAMDGASLEAVVATLMQGNGPGIIEILGAIALFLNAGRGPARILGLMGFVLIVGAQANGVDQSELLQKATELYELAQQIMQKFQAAPVI